MNWSTDISAAPRGRRVKTSKVVNGRKQTTVTIERERVWLASRCGKVILSYWIWPVTDGAKARWCMFGQNEKPLAWRPFVEGEFPRIVTKVKGSPDVVEYPNGAGPEYPSMLLGVAA